MNHGEMSLDSWMGALLGKMMSQHNFGAGQGSLRPTRPIDREKPKRLRVEAAQ